MSPGTVGNPFIVWAELARGLRGRFLAELGADKTDWTMQVLAQMAGLITQIDHLGVALRELERRDPAGYEAFLRALEQS